MYTLSHLQICTTTYLYTRTQVYITHLYTRTHVNITHLYTRTHVYIPHLYTRTHLYITLLYTPTHLAPTPCNISCLLGHVRMQVSKRAFFPHHSIQRHPKWLIGACVCVVGLYGRGVQSSKGARWCAEDKVEPLALYCAFYKQVWLATYCMQMGKDTSADVVVLEPDSRNQRRTSEVAIRRA